MQKLGKFSFKINVMPNGLEKRMSYNVNKTSVFIDSFIDSFIDNSSLGSLVRNLDKDDFKYLSQEFDSNVLDLANQKGFYAYEYMNGFEKFKEQLPSKESYIVLQFVDR